MVPGLQSVQASEHVGSVVAASMLSFFAACGILVPWPGIEPVSPALQGGFLTAGPLGKSHNFWYSFFTVNKSTMELCQLPNFQGCSLTAAETSDTEITEQQYFHTGLFMVGFILGQIF